MGKVMLLLLLVGAFILLSCQKSQPLLGDAHDHADFKVFLEGQEFNFTQEKYMSSENKTLSQFIDLHEMEGGTMHKHMNTVTLKTFFNSVQMTFNKTCFITDANNSFCNNGTKTVKIFVKQRNREWKQNNAFENYELQDEDKILITFGAQDSSQIKEQQDSISDNACVESGTCPEKGSPKDESSCLNNTGCIAE